MLCTHTSGTGPRAGESSLRVGFSSVAGAMAFIIGSGQIKFSPENGPRLPSDSMEAALEDWGCGSYVGLSDRG